MSCEGMELLLALCFASTARSHSWPRTRTDSHLPLFFFEFFPSLQVRVLCLSLLLLFFTSCCQRLQLLLFRFQLLLFNKLQLAQCS